MGKGDGSLFCDRADFGDDVPSGPLLLRCRCRYGTGQLQVSSGDCDQISVPRLNYLVENLAPPEAKTGEDQDGGGIADSTVGSCERALRGCVPPVI